MLVAVFHSVLAPVYCAAYTCAFILTRTYTFSWISFALLLFFCLHRADNLFVTINFTVTPSYSCRFASCVFTTEHCFYSAVDKTTKAGFAGIMMSTLYGNTNTNFFLLSQSIKPACDSLARGWLTSRGACSVFVCTFFRSLIFVFLSLYVFAPTLSESTEAVDANAIRGINFVSPIALCVFLSFRDSLPRLSLLLIVSHFPSFCDPKRTKVPKSSGVYFLS